MKLLSTCTIRSFDGSLVSNSKGHIIRVLLDNWLCQARPALLNINSNEPLYYTFTVKYGGSCNTIDDPYARVCVPNKVKNMKEKVFHLILNVNETRFLVQYESFECKGGMNKTVCNSK